MKIFTFEQLRNREPGREPDEVFYCKFREPARIEINHGLLWIKNLEDLGFVGFCVAVNFFAREWRTCHGASGGIADHPGEVADEEDDGVTHILKVFELADQNT